MFGSGQGLSVSMIVALIICILILTAAYFIFYFPKRKSNKAKSIGYGSLALPCLASLASGVSVGVYANFYIGVIAGIAIGIFSYDLLNSKSKAKIFASFNACFVNVLLFIGFAFGGVNKLYSIITASTQPLIPMQINGMGPGVGLLLLVLGFGAIYSSRTATADAIVRWLQDFEFKFVFSKKNIICAIALWSVALQAAYQSFAPIQNLLHVSWGLNYFTSVICSSLVCLTTFIAVFALLNPSKVSKQFSQNHLWGFIACMASVLTGISTIPYNTLNLKVVFWSIIAVFSCSLWGYQFINKSPNLYCRAMDLIRSDWSEKSGFDSMYHGFGASGSGLRSI